ncbi:MAG TPA: hypothetical protein DDZ88_16420 [Verrucomicrobiales bacterium]|nr:hypothetical protein [Verrucomicrobiales bacterium]
MPDNDFGALANSTLIHDLMDDFTQDLDPILSLAMDIGDTQSDAGIVRTLRPGQSVTITNYFGEVDPYDVNAAGGYVAQPYEVGAPVVVTCPSDPWARSVKLTAAEWRLLTGGPRTGAAYDALRRKINLEMMYSIKKKMVADFIALITAANYPDHTVSGVGTFARSTEIDIETELFKRNIKDRSNAKLILNPTAYGEWAKDHVAINTNVGGSSAQPLLSGGQQSQVTSFQVSRSNVSMPTDAARGFAYTKTAALLINRIPDEPGLDGVPSANGSDQFNSLATVIDPGTGFAFLMRTWKNWATGAVQLDIATIWKFAKLQAEAIERITAA